MTLGEGPILLLADEIEVDEQRRDHHRARQCRRDQGRSAAARGQHPVSRSRGPHRRHRQHHAAGARCVEAIYAELMSISGDLKDGLIEDSCVPGFAGEARVAASAARRIDGTRTEMDKAVYSPCPICAETDSSPLWQISASKVVHDEDTKEVVYKNAFFELFGVPVFYTPYFSHPDPSVDRKSGFISPSVGTDTELGFTLETPYYFDLAPNYDLTLAPIITSNEGVVLGGEFRHRVANGRYDLGGSITRGSEAENSNDDRSSRDEFRGHVVGDGRFALGGNWGWGYDLFVASDDTYLERYDFSDQDILENRLFTERISGRNYAAVNAYGFQGCAATTIRGSFHSSCRYSISNCRASRWSGDRGSFGQQPSGAHQNRRLGYAAFFRHRRLGTSLDWPARRSVPASAKPEGRLLRFERRSRYLVRRR